jgi:hypothetical protein
LERAKGQLSAQKLLLDIVNKPETAISQAYEHAAEGFVQYRFEWEEVFARSIAKGLPLAEAFAGRGDPDSGKEEGIETSHHGRRRS